ncbi:MAG TPA: rRNA maturation RNase YbeY [Stellaceae bacterium]|nr:rRNA maturation RNase YbeY [Stellaceae bacterium]
MTVAEACDRSFEIDIALPCPAWRDACPGIERLIEDAAAAALVRELAMGALGRAAVLDIRLGDDAEQRELNRRYCGRDAPTNVLAFPASDPGAPLPAGAPLLLGDVVLAFETVAREAAEQRKTLVDHARHLVVHGVLHLLGYDHATEAEAEAMEAREREILAGLGVPDPYRDIT